MCLLYRGNWVENGRAFERSIFHYDDVFPIFIGSSGFGGDKPGELKAREGL